MNMNTVITYCKNSRKWDVLGDLIDRNALNDGELAELFELAGLSNDAAEFMAEWYSEYACCAIDNLRYTYGIDHSIHQMTESELAEHLDFLEVSEDYYQENCGAIIRDAAFDGVIVIGD